MKIIHGLQIFSFMNNVVGEAYDLIWIADSKQNVHIQLA